MSIVLRYFGHSAVAITSIRGKQIFIDPWLKGNPVCPPDCVDPARVDLICLTHGHSDHTHNVAELAIATKATLCATYELAALLHKDGVPEAQLQYMNKGGEVEVDGIRIALTNAFHSSSYTTTDGATHYAGEPCGVVVTLESGESIYHAGDTLLFSDMALIKARFTPRVALLPIGDRFTMGPADAAIAMKLIDPEFVVPIHHSTFGLLSGTPDQFEEAASTQGVRGTIVALKPGESFTL